VIVIGTDLCGDCRATVALAHWGTPRRGPGNRQVTPPYITTPSGFQAGDKAGNRKCLRALDQYLTEWAWQMP
jgi:hypothetical protein